MLSIIVAVSLNNVIGCNNSLIWHIPEDLKRFKKLTSGKTIIMGRKTFQSLPRVLPNRDHVVISGDNNFFCDDTAVEVCHDLRDVVSTYKNKIDETFIIGGGSIYEATIDDVSMIYITYVFKEYNGDTYFPLVSLDDFYVLERGSRVYSEEEKCFYQFVVYKRY